MNLLQDNNGLLQPVEQEVHTLLICSLLKSTEIMLNTGSPFKGKEFAKFLSSQDIKYLTSSPHHPQRNDFIERQVQTIKHILSKTGKIQSFRKH